MTKGQILMFVGAAAFVIGIYLLIKLVISRNWVAVEGRIVGSDKSFRSSDAGRFEDAEIKYEYEVNGKTYTSNVIKVGGDVSSHPSKRKATDVDGLLLKYPVGSAVTVYYNPNFPRMACLEREGGEALVVCFIFGPLAFIVGYFFFD
jgi:hypothetical protein